MIILRFSLLVALPIFLAAPVLAQTSTPIPTEASGEAARYDVGATGRPTASGEPYNPERMTLAHPSFPFGTLVELTNEATGQTVTARVNDRESAAEGLRIRVSARTADQLGLPARGGTVTLRLDEDEIAFLQIRALRERDRTQAERPAAAAPPLEGRGFTIQIASFSDEGRANAKADQLRGAWVLPVVVGTERVYRVCYGVFGNAERAAATEARLRARGIEGFVKSLDASPVRTTALGGE